MKYKSRTRLNNKSATRQCIHNMPSSLVIITGATGHVGYRTLIETLKASYQIRAAVRNEASIKKIKAAESTQPYPYL
jgi:NADP-dependent 3-hydroxy acid dehydrogenase YdfG